MIDALTMLYLIAELKNMFSLYLNNLILKWFIGNIALIVSITLLFFTLYSFYLINLRKGQIIVGSPTTYAICVQPGEEGLTWVELPLIFYNNGAITQFISDLRLSLQQNSTISNYLYFEAIYEKMPLSDLGSNKERRSEVAHQFAIEGRKTYSGVFAFGWRPGGLVPSVGNCRSILEAKLNDNVNWEKISEFDINISTLTVNKLHTLRPYFNDPHIPNS